MSTPSFSVGQCPICGDGLCGIRIYHADSPRAYGLVICDECEALWTEPNLSLKPVFPGVFADSDMACSPVDGWPLWDGSSHWADLQECARLGWLSAIDPALVYHGPQPQDDDPTAEQAVSEAPV